MKLDIEIVLDNSVVDRVLEEGELVTASFIPGPYKDSIYARCGNGLYRIGPAGLVYVGGSGMKLFNVRPINKLRVEVEK